MGDEQMTEERGVVSQATRAPRSTAQATARPFVKPSTSVSTLPLSLRQELWNGIWQRLPAPIPVDAKKNHDSA